jgi:hypothetical protein
MALLNRRICHLSGIQKENLNRIVKELNDFLTEQHLPEDCYVDVYEDVTTCCGDFTPGVAVEIQAPNKPSLDGLKAALNTKFNEICSRENLTNHCESAQTSCDPV